MSEVNFDIPLSGGKSFGIGAVAGGEKGDGWVGRTPPTLVVIQFGNILCVDEDINELPQPIAIAVFLDFF